MDNEIRCTCKRLLCTIENEMYRVKSKHDGIDISFKAGYIICKCGNTKFLSRLETEFNVETLSKVEELSTLF